MSDIVVASNGILDVLVLIGLLVLIFVFLLKLYNVLNGSKIYDLSLSIIILAVGTFAYLFIEVGVMLSFAKDLEDMLLAEYNIYFWIARLLIIFIWVFWFVELIIYSIIKFNDSMDMNSLSRMAKRRYDRIR